MRNSLKIFLLLLTYVLIAVCTFGIVTWIYQVPVPQIPDLNYQLYIGIGAGILGLILGFIAAFARGRKPKAEKTQIPEPAVEETEAEEPVREAAAEVAEEAETAAEEVTEAVEETVQAAEEPVEEAVEETIEEVEEAVEDSAETAEEEITAAEEYAQEVIEPIEEIIEEVPAEELEEAVEEMPAEPEENKAFTPVIEEPVESLNAEIPPVVIVSPLGPRNIRKTEMIEEVIDDSELDEAIADTVEPTLFDMIDEVSETMERIDEPAEEAVEEEFIEPVLEERQLQPELSDTQESFINESKVSYMNDEGKPQFVITQNIEKVTEIPEEEKKPNFVGYDVKAERQAAFSSFLNKVLTTILILLLLGVIYWLAKKYLG